MSFWTKIRPWIEGAAGVAAAVFAPELLGAIGVGGGGAAAGAAEAGLAADAAAGGMAAADSGIAGSVAGAATGAAAASPAAVGAGSSIFGSGGASSYLAPAVGLLNGAATYLGGQQTNAANAQQAANQMAFQADQTGTAYQRAVKDMEAAGLNPMLAYSQGGASSGGGAQATLGNSVGQGVSSAMAGMQAMTGIAQTAATTEKTNAETQGQNLDNNLNSLRAAKMVQEIDTGGASARQLAALAENLKSDNLRIASESIMARERSKYAPEAAKYGIDSAQFDSQRKGFEAEAANYAAEGGLYDTFRKRLDIPKQRAESSYYSGIGQAQPYISGLGDLLNSALKGRNLFGH